MKLRVFGLCLCLSAGAWAETPPQEGQVAPVDPVIERLQSLQEMRMRMEQDWAGYLNAARANGIARQQQQAPADPQNVRQMRQDVVQNLQRLEERFRCLDVDLKGNNGNVVLVCGDNQGPIATNNQQAFGADLNVSGGGQ